MERRLRPAQHDELQGGARAPEQGGHRQGDLAQFVLPEQVHAVGKIADQVPGIPVCGAMVHAGVGYPEVDQGRHAVQAGDAGHAVIEQTAALTREQEVVGNPEGIVHHRADEPATHHGAQDDGGHGEALDPAVGHHQFAVGQVLGDDAVLGRRVGGRPEAHQGIGIQRVQPGDHEDTAQHLDAVADEHDPALGHGVGEGADEGRQEHVGDGEEELEQGFVLGRGLNLPQGGDGGDEQRVVGQRGEELRRHDDVEPAIHSGCRHLGCRGCMILPICIERVRGRGWNGKGRLRMGTPGAMALRIGLWMRYRARPRPGYPRPAPGRVARNTVDVPLRFWRVLPEANLISRAVGACHPSRDAWTRVARLQATRIRRTADPGPSKKIMIE